MKAKRGYDPDPPARALAVPGDRRNLLVAELNQALDLNYLESNGDGTIVSSRMVTRASPEYIRDHHEAYWEEGEAYQANVDRQYLGEPTYVPRSHRKQ